MSQTWENAHARGIVRVGTKPAPVFVLAAPVTTKTTAK